VSEYADGPAVGPAVGPGGRGFHGPRGSFLGRRDGFLWSGVVRESLDTLPGGDDRRGSGQEAAIRVLGHHPYCGHR